MSRRSSRWRAATRLEKCGARRSYGSRTEPAALWGVVDELTVPVLLVRGMRPQSVVDDADEAELLRRCATAEVAHLEEAGHSVQGDTPVELARLIAGFVGLP